MPRRLPRSPENPMPDEAPQPGADAATAPVVAHLSTARLKLGGALALGVAALVAVAGLVTRVSADQGLKAWTQAQAIPTISLAAVEGGGERQLVLPGDVQAFYTAPIHARVSGYLKRWYADI